MFEIDCARLYFRDDIKVKDGLYIQVPTVGEIRGYGECEYFSYARTITSVGADMKFQLWKLGVDYTTIEDYDLFIKYLFPILATFDETEKDRGLLMKDLSFRDFDVRMNKKTNELVLYDEDKDLIIDRFAYKYMAEVIRQIHFWKRNNEMPANNSTKMALIEDAEDEYNASRNKPFKSVLLPYISGLRIVGGGYGDIRSFDDMGIYALLYDARRAAHIMNADALLHGGYGGFADLSKADKNSLEIFGDI